MGVMCGGGKLLAVVRVLRGSAIGRAGGFSIARHARLPAAPNGRSSSRPTTLAN